MTTTTNDELAFAQAAAFAFVQVSRTFKKSVAREAFASNLLQYALSTPSGLTAMKTVNSGISKISQVRREVRHTDSGRFDLTVETNLGRIVIEVKVGAPFDQSQLDRYQGVEGVYQVAFLAPRKQADEALKWIKENTNSLIVSTKVVSKKWETFCNGGKRGDEALWSAIERVVSTLPSPALPIDFQNEFWKDCSLANQIQLDLGLAFAGLESFNKAIGQQGTMRVSTNAGNSDFWICRQRNRGNDRAKGLPRYTILEFDPRWDRGPLFISHGDVYCGTDDAMRVADIVDLLERGGSPRKRMNLRASNVKYESFTRALWAFMFAVQTGLRSAQPDIKIGAGISETGLWIGLETGRKIEYCVNLHRQGLMPLVLRSGTETKSLGETSSILTLIKDALKELNSA